MRGFKDAKGNRSKERKNRNSKADDVRFTLFLDFRKSPEFMSEDEQYNIDAELEADFMLA